MAVGLLLSAWIMVAADGPQVRAVIPADHACSEIAVVADHRPIVLTDRTAPDQDFPIHVCAADVSKDAIEINLAFDGQNERLKVMGARPKRIVVLGDTGCRIKGETIQACTNPKAWPLATIAKSAAAEHPDLVIHVGDYHYRETPCPEGDIRCTGSPWGDNWATWQADFIDPAEPLLSAAPWVMVRGNHEECRRAGRGWSALLAPVPLQDGKCLDAHPPYRVDLGGYSLFVIDDNDATDFLANSAAAARLGKDLATIPTDQPVWLLTHHPWHAVVKSVLGVVEGSNATLSEALGAGNSLPSSVQFLLSGHVHVWQVENFAQGRPPQLIAGTGGDVLDTGVPADLAGLISGGWAIHDGHSATSFGYAVMERQKSGWTVVAHKPDGSVLEQCRLDHGRIDCQQ